LVPVLAHWIPEVPLILETDMSDHMIIAILLTILEGEVHSIAFHSRTFYTTELNYDIHKKELFAIFKVFKKWHHYLERTVISIDIVINYENLEYFSTTKFLTRCQARWSKYLAQFNISIRFQPRKLDTKPDIQT